MKLMHPLICDSKILAACAAGFLATAQSPASFHLWEISQIYSNADGSVQYIELFNASNFEQFLSGQQIVVSRDGGQGSASYTFPSNLPHAQTGGAHVLVATGPIAGVEPDYVIPANFIHIDFASEATVFLPFSEVANANLVYGAIPTDGSQSLEVSGAIRNPATVTNFSGASAQLEAVESKAYGFLVTESNITAESFFGQLYVAEAPWVYSYNAATWWYIRDPENDLSEAPGTWAWVLGMAEVHYVSLIPSWIYCYATATWWYLYDPNADLTHGPGTWVYLMNEG